jgi:hypothetical protein
VRCTGLASAPGGAPGGAARSPRSCMASVGEHDARAFPLQLHRPFVARAFPSPAANNFEITKLTPVYIRYKLTKTTLLNDNRISTAPCTRSKALAREQLSGHVHGQRVRQLSCAKTHQSALGQLPPRLSACARGALPRALGAAVLCPAELCQGR